ncbi:MAG: stage 0 sporulation protein [Victivallales bacterium]|jgi:cell fate regulator YaaT (PSP1 superfamily)|nr:stage 0 sporulation protein [Victivallales bacterium]
MDRLFIIKLDNGSELEVKAPAELELKLHDTCVFRRDFYIDSGEIIREITELPPEAELSNLPVILHLANTRELADANNNYMRSRNAMKTARELVGNLGLTMKLLNAHYSLDGKLVIIQFSADGRVDFRELVKELSRALCTRIELRQIGVRDETGIYGGIAICGQKLCCCRFLKEFNSINVKMAKEQDLSLTPATISGACGRLKCCLKFEHEGYRELEKNMPKRGNWCDTPQGRGRICDRNLLTQTVSVQLETGNIVNMPRNEVTVSVSETARTRPNNNNERPTQECRERSHAGGQNDDSREQNNENRPSNQDVSQEK